MRIVKIITNKNFQFQCGDCGIGANVSLGKESRRPVGSSKIIKSNSKN